MGATRTINQSKRETIQKE